MTRANASRIYVVASTDGAHERLVRAGHPGAASRHATAVRVASQDDLARMISGGIQVEDATAPQPEHPPSGVIAGA